MIPRFYIMGSERKRPSSRKTIFTDGAPDDTFRPGMDMELSHWIPNRTPEPYRADTSTEICMNFVSRHSTADWELAINNHLDVDGVLAVFTLVHSETALHHRRWLIEAAEMGDFSGWGEEPAQILFQALTKYMYRSKHERIDIHDIYQGCFDALLEWLKDPRAVLQQDEDVRHGVQALAQSVERIESEKIYRRVHHERFVHYHIPVELSKQSLEKALHVPHFNALLSDDLWLHPQARNRWDRDKIQLISVDHPDGGWFYDLWYPSYMWADTPDSWRAPGFHFNGSTNGYYYGYEPLEQAVEELHSREKGEGSWVLTRELSPFESIVGRSFPVVLSFMDDQRDNPAPAPSQIPPQDVAELLASCF